MAVFAVLPRLIARVSGENPLAFLDATTSQDLSRLAHGENALTCLLDDKGRILAEMRAHALDDGTVLLDAEPACAHGITGWLARVAPLSACEVVDESDTWRFASIRGDDAAGKGTIVAPIDWGGSGIDVISVEFSTDATEVSVEKLDALRIAGGRPRYGIDFDDTTHIAETPLIDRAVSFTKGCYPGQESVARVQNLGRARRKLIGLSIDGDVAPAAGTVVFEGEMDVGAITSAAQVDGRVAAIAMARAEIGPAVTVAGAPATVRAL